MRKREIFIVAVLLLLLMAGVSTLQAQESIMRCYGGAGTDAFWDFVQADHGDIILVGGTTNFGYGRGDLYVVRTEADGDLLWARSYGGIFTEGDYAGIGRSTTNHYLAATYSNSFTGAAYYQMLLVYFDEKGDTLWTRRVGTETQRALNNRSVRVIGLPDGTFVVGGTSCSPSMAFTSWAPWVMKVDEDGTILWDNLYEFDEPCGQTFLDMVFDGTDLVICGSYGLDYPEEDRLDLYGYATKIDLEGNVLWSHTYRGEQDAALHGITCGDDGHYFGTGFTNANLTRDGTYTLGDLWVLEMDADGDSLFSLIHSNGTLIEGRSIAYRDSNFVICGGRCATLATPSKSYWIKIEYPDNVIAESTLEGGVRTWETLNKVYNNSVYDVFMAGYVTDGTSNGFQATFLFEEGLLSVPEEQGHAALPSSIHLADPYPNPFNSTVVIPFTLPGTVSVTLTVTDILGRQVTQLTDRVYSAGRHEVIWDGKNDAETVVPSGTYFVTLKSDAGYTTRKTVMLK